MTFSVRLKPRRALPFYCRHPWVLPSALLELDTQIPAGSEVDLLTHNGDWIARGLYNGASRTPVRLYSWVTGEALDADFWARRIDSALELRRGMLSSNRSAAIRLVNSEGDRFSGLIVDRFGPHLVIQPNTLGIGQRLDGILPILESRLAPESITVRVDPGTAKREGCDPAAWPRTQGEPPEIAFFEEHGLRYGVELSTGQKTGFFLDQRENRALAARWLAGRKVLDVCCYSGAFGLTAIHLGHAEHVLGIDSSVRAIELARANAELNQIRQIEFHVADMYDGMDAFRKEGRLFDAVILDPPKFIRGRPGLSDALKAYHHLNRLALDLLVPDGILVTCSCSGSVSAAHFQEMLFGVSTRARREIQILSKTGAGPDHPTLINCPETEYLKCFICRAA